ncbi:hypothetical protein P9112_010996 [Eukaryota sp. TZLM1-RC]
MHMRIIDVTQSLVEEEPDVRLISSMSRLVAGSSMTFIDQLLQISTADIAVGFGLVPVKRRLLVPRRALFSANDSYRNFICRPHM